MPTGRKSPECRFAVATALARGETARESARGAGVSERAVHNWLDDPTFKAQIETIREKIFESAVAKLIAGADGAAVQLRRLVKSQDERISLNASKSILETAGKFRELLDHEKRLAALEARLTA